MNYCTSNNAIHLPKSSHKNSFLTIMLSQRLYLVEFPESPLKCYLFFSWPSLLPSHFLLNFNISILFPSDWLTNYVKTVLQRKHVL